MHIPYSCVLPLGFLYTAFRHSGHLPCECMYLSFWHAVCWLWLVFPFSWPKCFLKDGFKLRILSRLDSSQRYILVVFDCRNNHKLSSWFLSTECMPFFIIQMRAMNTCWDSASKRCLFLKVLSTVCVCLFSGYRVLQFLYFVMPLKTCFVSTLSCIQAVIGVFPDVTMIYRV